MIFNLDPIDALATYVRARSFNEDLEGKNLDSLIKSEQFVKYLIEYTREFIRSYHYWKDDILDKVAAYMHIGGLKVGVI